MCGNVTSVSISAAGALWAVLESYEMEKGTVQGVIARRVGISHACPLGTGWEHTVGTGWNYVCSRVTPPL